MPQWVRQEHGYVTLCVKTLLQNSVVPWIKMFPLVFKSLYDHAWKMLSCVLQNLKNKSFSMTPHHCQISCQNIMPQNFFLEHCLPPLGQSSKPFSLYSLLRRSIFFTRCSLNMVCINCWDIARWRLQSLPVKIFLRVSGWTTNATSITWFHTKLSAKVSSCGTQLYDVCLAGNSFFPTAIRRLN